jgi:hypothetical protein
MLNFKNYDIQIQNLWVGVNAIIKQINKSTEQLDKLILNVGNLQEQVIILAKIQAQHKEIINFLMKNILVDANKSDEVQQDLLNMMAKIKETENNIKEKIKEKK